VFRVGIVPGVNPDRWLRVWRERLADVPLELVHLAAADAEARLRAGDADVALVRLPVDRDGLSVIPLYTETTVVLVARDNVLTAADELAPGDLVDDVVLVDATLTWDDAPGERFAGAGPTSTEAAVDLVAAGVAVLAAPQSVARLHQRKGLAVRPVPDAPGSTVALAWLVDRYDDVVEELVGIVRGRTAASSRGRGAAGGSETAPGGTDRSRARAGGSAAGKRDQKPARAKPQPKGKPARGKPPRGAGGRRKGR
jgi:DNA-binding transcriptional LysR family regulator